MAEGRAASKPKVPVTVLTGFLGSGKTTLLNWILTKKHGKKIAVIENEFGEVGVDDALLKSVISTDEIVFDMNNGCICCTVRGDLIEAFKKLMKRKVKLDAVIIETTGLADPAPVCQTFFVDKDVSEYAELDAVITVVDAKHIIDHLDEVKPDGVENESVEQIAFADRILLNKIDLVSEEQLAAVESRIKSLNHVAEIVRTNLKSESIPIEKIMGIKSFNLERVLEMDAEFLDDGKEHKHDSTVSSVGFCIPGEMNIGKLGMWINVLMKSKGADLFRYKGVLAVKGKEEKFIFQGVHMLFDGDFSEKWKDGEDKLNRFVFIGKNISRDMFEERFKACLVTEDLRFPIGTRVKCKISKGWAPGSVIKQWDDGNPYRVLLDDGVEIWAPEDDDSLIRTLSKSPRLA